MLENHSEIYGAYCPRLKLYCMIWHGIGMFWVGGGSSRHRLWTQSIYEMVQNGKRRKQIVAGGKAGKEHQGTEP